MFLRLYLNAATAGSLPHLGAGCLLPTVSASEARAVTATIVEPVATDVVGWPAHV
jgi:hypothetical protein